MGWINYSPKRGIGLGAQLFQDDPLVRYFIDIKDMNVAYIVKELSDEEKQSSKKLYKFIKMNYDPEIVKEKGSPKFTVKEFEHNHELIGYIIKHKACNSEYQRYFTINNILQ